MLTALVLLPVAAGLAVWVAGDRRHRLGRALALAALASTAAVAVAAAFVAPTASLRWGAGLRLQLEVDATARAPMVLVAVVGLAVVAYALGYGEPGGRARMVGLLVAFVGTMELLLVAADLLTLLVAWELVGLLSWALIAHHWSGDAPAQAAHAFLATRAGDLGLFVAAGAAFAATGRLDFASLPARGAGPAAVVAAGVLVAAAAKSAQLPFSPWLFSAMAGPTPASALLHSATMVAAGAYLLARLHPVLEPVAWFGPVTVAVGLATALAGGLVAATQPDAKKLLAASTSAHYGLMFVAVGAGYPAVAVAHLVAHGLAKALLFVAAGEAAEAAGSTALARLRAAPRLPLVGGLALAGTLALAALPPLGAAWTKEHVVAAAAHIAPGLGLAVVAAGALSVWYATRFQLLALGGTGPGVGPAPGPGARAALVLLAGAGAALGVVWLPGGGERVREVVGAALPPVAAWEVAASLASVALAGAAAWWWHHAVRPAGAGSRVRAVVAGWFDLPRATRVVVVEPTLALARATARLDDRVLDRAVATVAATGAGAARRLARGDDRVVDAGVRAAARAGAWAGSFLGRVGERRIDGAVEGLARLAGAVGRSAPRLQPGPAHRYYAGMAAGVVTLVALAALWAVT